MTQLTDSPGIHHVTGLADDPQTNVDWYAGTVGLRFCKRTVNFEDILGYHLYYGDAIGSPGTVVTFFPTAAADPGRVGSPQPTALAFAVPEGSLGYWTDRLETRGIDVAERSRFDERTLSFADPDGTPIELVAVAADSEPRGTEPWIDGPIPESAAVRGIRGVTLDSVNPYATAATLETLGFDRGGQEGHRVRYRASGDRATTVDVLDRPPEFGREGPGTFHHVAVRAPDVEELYDWHDLFRERDYDVSRVKDRHFFHSLYVREPGGILFELATETPGLATAEDESGAPVAGESLYLPPRFDADRSLIESQLPELRLPDDAGANDAGLDDESTREGE
ncbi:VOC family protein [Halosolutus gelatinilyticus]|uniref:VOC family protein n=1 Tax=Halosolutus gelatinilyticus TaxID=2931975 RepID=UPI001FF1E6F6|nr:VOC family protein [Halosolutus gelatinilyticus]